MTRLACMTFCLVLAAAMAQAQAVTVRSGEHEGFSRLVIGLPARSDWRLDGAGRDRILRIDRAGLDFRTATVFERIPRTRLAGLEPLGPQSGLRLRLNCDCPVEGFWHGESFLVLDIRDPDPDAPGAAPEGSGPRPREDEAPPPIAARSDAERSRPAPVRPLVPAAGRAAGALAARGLDGLLETAPPATGPRRARTDPTLAGSRARLLQELGRATAFGLLVPRRDPPPAPDPAADTPAQRTDAPPPRADPPVPPAAPSAPAAPALIARSGLDDNVIGTVFDDTVAPDGGLCLSSAALDPGAWAGPGPFAAQIGPLRLRLSAERDRTNSEAALALARRYLHFGFGAEAAQTLSLADPSPRDAAILGAMAEIMDRGHAAPGSILAGQLTCTGPAALWSALSYEALPANVAIDSDAVLRALSALPRHLRDHLGPGLARRFLASGRRATAERIRRLLARDGIEGPAAERLAGAEIDLAEGRLDEADTALEEVVDSNAEAAAEALLRRIEGRLGAGRGIPPEMAQLAGAFAQEHRNNPVGPRLARAYVMATAAAGDFETAFSELTRLMPDLPADPQRQVTARLMTLLAENADDLAFLRHATAGRAAAAPDLPVAAGNAVAVRLLELGFTGIAADYLAPGTGTATGAEGPGQRARQILRARLSLQTNRPRQAEVDLLGLGGPEVNRWRARARSMIGQHRAAQALYESGDAGGEAAREAFLAGHWPLAKTIEDPELRALAEILPGAGESAEEPAGLLGRSRARAERARRAHEVISGILRAPSR